MAMSKKKRVLLIVIAIVVLVPLIAGIILLFSLGAIVKAGFETAGPRLLGVETKLSAADIGVFSGVIDLHGLVVGNPAGFEATEFVTAQRIKVSADIGAIFHKEIHVREIILDVPEFSFEYKPGKSNVGAIMERLEKDKEPTPTGETDKEQKEPMRLRIDLVKISNAKIHVWIAGEKIVSLTLPEVEVRNINGPDGKGVSPKEAVANIMASIRGPAESLIQSNPATRAAAELIGGLAAGGAKALEGGKEVLTGAGKAAMEVGDGLGGALKKTGDGILGIKKKIVGD